MSTKTPGYTPPLDHLLTLGCPGCPDGGEEPWRDEPFADYAHMGIAVEHVPELRRMAFDRSLAGGDSPGSYGPVHAARALGALHPAEMLPDLIELTRRLERDDDEGGLEDMPAIFARFGASAIDPLARVAGDSRESFGTRLYLLTSIERIATEHAQTRDRVVKVFADMLKYATYGNPGINAHIISSLVELGAAEALPAIRAAFATGRVDAMCCGRLADIEQEIGLTPEQRTAYHRAEIDRAESELEGMSEREALDVIIERSRQRMRQS